MIINYNKDIKLASQQYRAWSETQTKWMCFILVAKANHLKDKQGKQGLKLVVCL